jgi:hypothetical protein
MGQDPSIRREWIEEHVEFSLEDNFIEMKKDNVSSIEEEEGEDNE